MSENRKKKDLFLSIVIAALNEEPSIRETYDNVLKSISDISIVNKYEIIFVDDGSSDNTYNEIIKLTNANKNVKAVKLRKNYGKSSALANGFKIAEGDILITIDADLQDDIFAFSRLIDKYLEGYDVISGWKNKRKDNFFRVWGSRVFNFLISKLIKFKFKDLNSGLKLYSKDVYKKIIVYGEQHRFIPWIAHMMGYKITEIPVKHFERKYGTSKYPTFRILGFIDMVIVYFLYSYHKKPFHVFSYFALPIFGTGFIIFIWLLLRHFYWWYSGLIEYQMNMRPLLVLSLIAMVIGLFIFLFGLLSELLVSIFYKLRNSQPIDNVDEIKEIVSK